MILGAVGDPHSIAKGRLGRPAPSAENPRRPGGPHVVDLFSAQGIFSESSAARTRVRMPCPALSLDRCFTLFPVATAFASVLSLQ
jgi:hypothetical protein